MVTFTPYGSHGGYGVKVVFPCLTINTPWGPVKIGGQCTPEMNPVKKEVPVAPPTPAVKMMPYVLMGGVGLAALFILARRREERKK